MAWAKSAPPVSSKILRFRSSIIGISSRSISSSSIGPRFSGRKLPLTRTWGGQSTFRCKSLPSSFTSAANSLSTSSSCLRIVRLLGLRVGSGSHASLLLLVFL